jgi:alpha-glucosidase (family GH31 glycosyl hydrolase)
MRTHCDACERRMWVFKSVFPYLQDAAWLRNALLPYFYTAARGAYDTGVAPVHPLYYGELARTRAR